MSVVPLHSARYLFSSPAGFELVRSTIQPVVGYPPHDYQLEGVCKVLDGSDLVAILPTGAGKTSYYTFYMLMLLELHKNPGLCAPASVDVPADPCMVTVYPTNGLEEEQAATFERAGIKTLIINGDTLSQAQGEHRNLWVEARTDVAILLLSPEQLSSPGFESLLQDPSFQRRVCCLGIDEIHLLYSWGQQFRQSYRQVAHIRARMPSHVHLIGTTATMLVGHTQETILSFLGLRAGDFYLIRRSNLRHSVRTIWRTLSHGLGNWTFPDLKWILDSGRRTVIHCRTIALAFHLAIYLWHIASPAATRAKRIRLYHALNWASYNTETRRLMREDADAQIVIATASFMVGIDLPNIEDVVILGNLSTADEHVQWEGRAGRDARVVLDARCITYVSRKALQTARAMCEMKSGGEKKGDTAAKNPKAIQMDISMAKLLIAPCSSTMQNELYGNPPSDPPCTCDACGLAVSGGISQPAVPCRCSGCEPEDLVENIKLKRKDDNPVPRRKRLTKAMRREGMKRLRALRKDLYLSTNTNVSRALPPSVFLPDTIMKMFLDRFALVETKEDLRITIAGRIHLLPHLDTLWTVMQDLQDLFDGMRTTKAPTTLCRDPSTADLEVARNDWPSVSAMEVRQPSRAGRSAQTATGDSNNSVFTGTFQISMPATSGAGDVPVLALTSTQPEASTASQGYKAGMIQWKLEVPERNQQSSLHVTPTCNATSPKARKRAGTATAPNARPMKKHRGVDKENSVTHADSSSGHAV
ncbi:P-loop containing nucleoside triphosphate hydrolase protein [Pilatotrama ljubarskyi]|nr:P-loop containing nucleoside triphosphate hydrolase protein [Pilatotrama ljubarskyi]